MLFWKKRVYIYQSYHVLTHLTYITFFFMFTRNMKHEISITVESSFEDLTLEVSAISNNSKNLGTWHLSKALT